MSERDILVTTFDVEVFNFWYNVLDITNELKIEGNVLSHFENTEQYDLNPLLQGNPKMLFIATGNNNFLSEMNFNALVKVLKQLSSIDKYIIVDRQLAKQLGLSPTELNELGIRAIIHEYMSIMEVAKIFHLVKAGGIILNK